METCQDRLRAVRRFNPDLDIYGLYGGEPSGAKDAEKALAPLLDDFWAYPEVKDPRWKWVNGDLMIARWFRDRGSVLSWDTVFVIQWDMLVAAPLEKLFHMLRRDQILLSGFRPIDDVKGVWWWAKGADPESAQALADFQKFLSRTFHYEGPVFACLFVVACLPRIFLERFVALGPPTVGFLEYKLPTLAKVLEVPVCEADAFRPGGWNPKAGLAGLSASEQFLNAIGCEPQHSSILKEFLREDGHRLFHPVRRPIKSWMLDARHARWLWPLIRAKEILVSVKSDLGKMYREYRQVT